MVVREFNLRIWFSSVLIALTTIAAWLVFVSPLRGGSAWSGEVRQEEERVIERVVWGFNGKIRLGFWSPVTIFLNDSAQSQSVEWIEVLALDGDDVECSYTFPVLRTEGPQRSVQGLFRLGRSRSKLTVRLLDHQKQIVDEQSIQVQKSSEPVRSESATQRIILVLGTIEVPDDLFSSQLTDPDNGTLLLQDLEIETLPQDPLGYRGVDTLVLPLNDQEYLSKLTPKQVQALVDWLRNGGRLLLLVSPEQTGDLAVGGRWNQISIFETLGSRPIKSVSRLETFVESKSPLLRTSQESLTVSDLNSPLITSLVSQNGIHLAGRYSLGRGVVNFLAFSLDDPLVSRWEDSNRLVERLLLLGISPSVTNKTDNGRIMNNGYRDFAGQLRLPMEEFRSVNFVPFTIIAILVSLFLLIIGPGDYFLLRLLGKRMHWTWVTFPLIVGAFCWFAYWLNQQAKDESLRLNHVELLDIDSRSGSSHGQVWASIYSPNSTQSTVELGLNSSDLDSVQTLELGWMGQPGSGLGGMQTTTPALTLSDQYRCVREKKVGVDQISLIDFPTAVASVRTLSGSWTGQLKLSGNSHLVRTKKLDRLEGHVVNPLSFVLRRPRLFYDDSIFSVDGDLKPLDSFDLFADAKERTVKSQLTGRGGQAGMDGNRAQPWNAADTDVEKIIQMMMFHDAAGGQSYSGLTNHYFGSIETSDRLLRTQAYLVGEVERPLSSIRIDGEATLEKFEKRICLVRILIPVEIEK